MEVGGGIACCPDSLGSLAQIHWGKSRRGTEVLFSPASAGIVWRGSTIKKPFRGVSHFISFERKGSNTVLVTKQLLSLPALKLWSSLQSQTQVELTEGAWRSNCEFKEQNVLPQALQGSSASSTVMGRRWKGEVRSGKRCNQGRGRGRRRGNTWERKGEKKKNRQKTYF